MIKRLKRPAHPRKESDRRKTVILFDGDDTLWLTQRHYDETIARFISFLASLGFRKRMAKKVFDRTDLANVAKLGLSRERFPQSMVETYTHLSETQGIRLDRRTAMAVRTIGRAVFSSLPQLRPETKSVLRQLRRRHRVVLLTAGDPRIQRAKIRQLGIAKYFDRVVITPLKNEAVFKAVLQDLEVAPDSAIMVGNSLRSDIIPAAAAGLTPVQIIARGWQYDRAESALPTLRKIRSLRPVPEIATKVFGPNYVK